MKISEKRLHEIIMEEIQEAKKRDYKAEYKKYGSSTKAKKYRAELNKYNRKKGTYGNGDGKDASHKGGKIVGFEEQSKNRGRAEKSRLKQEGSMDKEKIPADLKRFMDRFIDKLQDKKLTRQKQKSILYKVVKGLGISPQELMMYVQRVKKGL